MQPRCQLILSFLIFEDSVFHMSARIFVICRAYFFRFQLFGVHL